MKNWNFSSLNNFLGAISDRLGTVSAFFFSSFCFVAGTLVVLIITLIRLCQSLARKVAKNTKEQIEDSETKTYFIPK